MNKLKGLQRNYTIPLWSNKLWLITILMLLWQVYAYASLGLLPKLSWWIVFLPIYVMPAIALAFMTLILGTCAIAMFLAFLALAHEWLTKSKQ